MDVRQDRVCPGDDGLLADRLLGILLTYFYTMDYVVNPSTNVRQKCTTAMWTCVMAEKFALHGLQRRALAQLETLLMGPCHADTDLMVDLIDIAYVGVVPTLRWLTNSDDNDQEEDDGPAEGIADRSGDGSPSHDGDCESEATRACGYADLIDVVNMRASPPEALSTLSSCEVCRRLRSKFPSAFSVSRRERDVLTLMTGVPSTPRVAEMALSSYLSSYLDYFRRSPEFMDRVRRWREFAVDLIQASVGVREAHRVSGACDIPRTG